jgi:surface protein
MSGLFQNAPDFNEDLWWDTSSVTTMKRMFQGAKSFNQDLSDWDVSSVTDMSYMFHRSLSFKATLVLGTHPV